MHGRCVARREARGKFKHGNSVAVTAEVNFAIGRHGLRFYFAALPMNETTDARLLRLHSADNVLTVISTLEAGENIRVGAARVTVAARLGIGHKVAARDIAAGERILKYGAPIGSATRAISVGEHVHTHNVRSDYIPTFARGEGAHYEHAQP